MEVVPDDYALIEDRLHHYVDAGFALILTTGGTGLTPDDVTPEATRAVIDARRARDRRGAARRVACATRRWAMLTRGVAGIAGQHADRQLPRQPEGDRRDVSASSPGAAPTPSTTLRREGGRDGGH